MGNTSKTLALVLILMMSISCGGLLTVNPASAQTIPTPSIPEFTVNFVPASYSVTTTNPYTGVNTTQTFDNSTIEVIIKNQPFTAYYDASIDQNISLYYNIQDKGHYTENWVDIYSGYDNPNPYPTPSNSEYTVISMPSNYPTGGKVDFQVEAMIGYINETYYMVWAGPTAGPKFIFSFVGEKSGWSNTQTITIGEASNSSSPPPTSTPSIPELSWLVIVPLLLSVFFVVAIVRHRKTADLSKQNLIDNTVIVLI